MSRRRRGRPRTRRRAIWKFAAVVVAAIIVAVAVYSYTETYRVEVKEYTFASPDVPAGFDGTRVVLLTDVHRSFYFTDKRLSGIVDEVNGLDADIVVLGGDYVYGGEDLEEAAFEQLGRLEAPLGVFAVLGNHDYAQLGDDLNDPGPAIAAAAKAGIPVLDNGGKWIEKSGQRFWLAGVSDLAQGDPRLVPALAGTGAADLVVLASHEPDFAEELQPGTVDLVLSGHTHGGQMTFFGLWAPFVPSEYGQKYRTGVVLNGATTVIVSNGVGTIFPPLRFFARPQIVVITLKKAA
jgi:uncharacterized protein